MAHADYYEILGVGPEAEPTEIRQAYKRELVKPCPGEAGGDAERARLTEEAGTVLLNPVARAAYDDLCVGHDLIEETVTAIITQFNWRT